VELGIIRKKTAGGSNLSNVCELPIEALIEYVALFQKGDETSEASKELLIEQHNQLIV
jgi:hypothetical protein